MEAILSTAADNLGSPMILCFVLGVLAALARSDLSFPEAVAKGMSLYLLFAIGFKGGVGVAEHGGGLELELREGPVDQLLDPLVAGAVGDEHPGQGPDLHRLAVVAG